MPSDAARRLTLQHKDAQAALTAATATAVAARWRLLDPDDLDGTREAWTAAVLPILAAAYARSAELAAAYLAAYRALEIGTTIPPVPPPPFPIRAAATSIDVTGPISVKRNVARGIPIDRAMDVARASSSAAGSRHAAEGGRETIRRTTASDTEAAGYARVASAGACKYCSGLTGITFDTDRVFAAHDGCSCTAEPVFR